MAKERVGPHELFMTGLRLPTYLEGRGGTRGGTLKVEEGASVLTVFLRAVLNKIR